MKRRSFLKGILGVAAIPLTGLPAPAQFVVWGTVTAQFDNPALYMDWKSKEIFVNAPMTIEDLYDRLQGEWNEKKNLSEGAAWSRGNPLHRIADSKACLFSGGRSSHTEKTRGRDR